MARDGGRPGLARFSRVPRERGRCRPTRGQALVEFAMVVPLFFMVMFGLIDLGRYVYTANALNQATREAARYGTVPSWAAECPAGVSPVARDGCVSATTVGRLAGVDRGAVVVTVACQRLDARTGAMGTVAIDGCRTNDVLVVTSRTTFTLLTPLVAQFLGSQQIDGLTQMTVN